MPQLSNDTKEKIEGYTAMGSMFVKVLMASFPLLFVPQECNDSTCSMGQKFTAWKFITLVNFITFGSEPDIINIYIINFLSFLILLFLIIFTTRYAVINII